MASSTISLHTSESGMMSKKIGFTLVILTLATGWGTTHADDADLARKAEEVLKSHCFQCHGKEGSAKGGLNFVLDREKLAARGKLVPGKPGESTLYQRMRDGEMPPEAVKERLKEEDLATVRRWIEADAPAFHAPAARREFISEIDVVYLIQSDLEKFDPRQRRFVRYFTFGNLLNTGASEQEMHVCRQALSKLLNSLSWHPRSALPKAIDPAGAVYRIDLRDYLWNDQTWTRILAAYPHYLPQKGSAMKAIVSATGTSLPYVRADWFVANASRPPLYHDLLQLPVTDRDLERLLRVDVNLGIQEERVARAGFNGSGIARNNRLIERHDSGYGAYWRSYDFAENVDRQNLFEHPLGPQQGRDSFVHSGSEIIFSLPNGLQGYFVVDANGRRIDRAPIEVVSDPKRPDKLVETGLSCISCHSRGLHPKSDQVRAHVEKNPNAFSKEDAALVRALHPPDEKFKSLMDEDIARFVKALEKAEAPAAETEPVLALALRYEGELDLVHAAAEVDFRPEDFAARLRRSDALSRTLGPLNVKGGAVQRQVFLAVLPDVLREFGLGDGSRVILTSDISTTPITGSKPFEGHKGHIHGIAFAPDGKRALSGSEDGTARLWDVATGTEARRFEGHTNEVTAVTFSPDGARILTGSADRTVRLWDVAGGEVRKLAGHTDRVSSLAFSPDGKHALSGSSDRSICLWNLETGEIVRRFAGHTGPVAAVVFSPDGKSVLSVASDRSVRLWDLETGREMRVLDGHTKEVCCVAFSPDGKHAVSGGNDNMVRLWDLETGQLTRTFNGHSSAVIRVAFSPDGGRILSGNSQYQASDKPIRIWETSGREVFGLGGKTDTIWSLAFSPDGCQAISGTAEKTMKLWQIGK